MCVLDRLLSGVTLERAFAWLCKQRRRWSDTVDVWSLRREWPAEKARLRADPPAGARSVPALTTEVCGSRSLPVAREPTGAARTRESR